MSTPTADTPTRLKSDDEPGNRYLEEDLPGGLTTSEIFWRDHQQWLEERGYMLRSRWHPNWVPSWLSSKKHSEYRMFRFEDGDHPLLAFKMLDARRISDGEVIMLKKVKVRDASRTQPELTMGPMFRTEPYTSDPRNHCIPIYEILTLPDVNNIVLLAMPRLERWDDPPFETIGEAVEFCRQIFEGLHFLHENHIAHNDIKPDNIMMDSRPLFDADMHPTTISRTYDWNKLPACRPRTRRPVKYYYIDFDACEKYDPSAGPARKAEPFGGDPTVPEFWQNPGKPHDPFAADVYRIGNVIRRKVSGGAPVEPFDPRNPNREHQRLNPSFAFIQPLILDMTQDDPTKRPKMEEVVSRFADIVKGMGELKLRSPTHNYYESKFGRFKAASAHWSRQLYNMAARVPAIPTPKK
ncbi:hypothetical protein L218DRAFT_1080200 [Marasmius fiardii PR-910]|nr:hypothetical protein L218DRAFT_1080200 [Marasmius fiardii PR-910]